MPSPALDALAAALEAIDGPSHGPREWERTRDTILSLAAVLASTSDGDAAEVLGALGLQCVQLRASIAGTRPPTRRPQYVSMLSTLAWADLVRRGPGALGAAADRVGLQLGALAAAAVAAHTKLLFLRTAEVSSSVRDLGDVPFLLDELHRLALVAEQFAFGLDSLAAKARFAAALRATCCKPALLLDVLAATRDALLLTDKLAERWQEPDLLIASKEGYDAANKSVKFLVDLSSLPMAHAPDRGAGCERRRRPAAAAAACRAALRTEAATLTSFARRAGQRARPSRGAADAQHSTR